jgi:hypothetical protein
VRCTHRVWQSCTPPNSAHTSMHVFFAPPTSLEPAAEVLSGSGRLCFFAYLRRTPPATHPSQRVRLPSAAQSSRGGF